MGTWDVGPFDNHAAIEVLAAIRAGSFDIERFKKTSADLPLDVEDTEAAIALGTLAKTPRDRLPEGVKPEAIRPLCTPQTRAWLRKRINAALEPDTSPAYAVWETTGELEQWIRTARAALP
ncbi:DUF4259 domain-containing protein [Corynebacterium sp.]|uniref:DUF4259 domain-containing protein n=1 Tax=Corynebacterium sp. TaxID=1720 RepID=UPI0026DA9132|nr:DUF4259 domain-containing protein [Corynebacterium sp.]MDO5031793.1 DUF4259 domain-containing protein [Corynebacterium sp.]